MNEASSLGLELLKGIIFPQCSRLKFICWTRLHTRYTDWLSLCLPSALANLFLKLIFELVINSLSLPINASKTKVFSLMSLLQQILKSVILPNFEEYQFPEKEQLRLSYVMQSEPVCPNTLIG